MAIINQKLYLNQSIVSNNQKQNAQAKTQATVKTVAKKPATKTVASVVDDLKNGKTTVALATVDLKSLGATIFQQRSGNKTILTIKDKAGKVYTVTTNSTMQVSTKTSGTQSKVNAQTIKQINTKQAESIQQKQVEELVAEYEKMVEENNIKPKDFDLWPSEKAFEGTESVYKTIDKYTEQQYQDALYDMLCLTDGDIGGFVIPDNVTAGDMQEFLIGRLKYNLSGDNLCSPSTRTWDVPTKQHRDMLGMNQTWLQENMDDIIKAANDAFCKLADDYSYNSGKIKGTSSKRKERCQNLVKEFQNTFNKVLKEKLKTAKKPVLKTMSTTYDKTKANGLTEKEYQLKANMNNMAVLLNDLVKSQGEFYVDLYGTGKPVTATKAISILLESTKDVNVKAFQRQIDEAKANQAKDDLKNGKNVKDLENLPFNNFYEQNRAYSYQEYQPGRTNSNTTPTNTRLNAPGRRNSDDTVDGGDLDGVDCTPDDPIIDGGELPEVTCRPKDTRNAEELKRQRDYWVGGGAWANLGWGMVGGGGTGGAGGTGGTSGAGGGKGTSPATVIQKASHANAKEDINAMAIVDGIFLMDDFYIEPFGTAVSLTGDVSKSFTRGLGIIGAVGFAVDVATYAVDDNKTWQDTTSLVLSGAAMVAGAVSIVFPPAALVCGILSVGLGLASTGFSLWGNAVDSKEK